MTSLSGKTGDTIAKFYTKNYSLAIERVEVERETDACVWVRTKWRGTLGDARREKKITSYDQYHDTWENAHAHAYLLARSQKQVDGLKEQLQKARTTLGQIQSLQKPAEAQ